MSLTYSFNCFNKGWEKRQTKTYLCDKSTHVAYPKQVNNLINHIFHARGVRLMLNGSPWKRTTTQRKSSPYGVQVEHCRTSLYHVSWKYSGGTGYVYSRETLRRFKRALRARVPQHYQYEDVAEGVCVKAQGVLPVSTRDSNGRETFIPIPLEIHLTSGYVGDESTWLKEVNYTGP